MHSADTSPSTGPYIHVEEGFQALFDERADVFVAGALLGHGSEKLARPCTERSQPSG